MIGCICDIVEPTAVDHIDFYMSLAHHQASLHNEALPVFLSEMYRTGHMQQNFNAR